MPVPLFVGTFVRVVDPPGLSYSRSAGAESGDIAEERKLVQAVSADDLDEPAECELQVIGNFGDAARLRCSGPSGPRACERAPGTAAPPGRTDHRDDQVPEMGPDRRTPRHPCRDRRSRGPWSARRGSRGAGRDRGSGRLVAQRREAQGRDDRRQEVDGLHEAPGAGSRRAARVASGRSTGVWISSS